MPNVVRHLRRRFPAGLAYLLVLACGCWSAVFRASAQSDSQSKAARIARIAQVTNWPAKKLGPSKPLVIGIIGAPSMEELLQEQCRRLNGGNVIVRPLSALEEIRGCHVLFVSASEQAQLSRILRQTRGEPILTIGESENFMREGGIVTLTMISGTAQFTCDISNMRRARLEIDPEALALANPPPQR